MAKNVFETLMGGVVLVVALGFIILAYQGGHVKSTVRNGLTLKARFDRIDGLNVGSDVRISGMKVGSVTEQNLDPQNYVAIVTLSVDGTVKLPKDSTAEIIGDGLLGAKYVAIVPGGSEEKFKNGDEIQFTQSAISIESLIGKFMFGAADKNKDKDKDAPASDGKSAAAPAKKGDDIF